jgi:choline dehydrogenase-like flavoprotein
VPNDFRLRTAHGRGTDWPITYDELEPFYGEAEHEIGVAGDSNETLGSSRSAGYPMPAIPQTFLDKA